MRFLKEPLLHFLLMGAALFVVFRLVNADPGPSDHQIVVSAGRVEQLAGTFARVWQRPPTAAELKALVDDFLVEEVFYREAVAIGLDQDDTVIRRRLRQKMEFLAVETAALVDPDDEELQEYLDRHPDDFRRDLRLTFQQVFFDFRKLGPDPDQALTEHLAALRSGSPVEGDPTLLPPVLTDTALPQIAGTFGPRFAGSIEPLPVGQWHGPIQSDYGWHFVRLDERVPGRLPPLSEIRQEVVLEWTNERRIEFNRRFVEGLLARYDVVIDWPQPEPDNTPITSGGGR